MVDGGTGRGPRAAGRRGRVWPVPGAVRRVVRGTTGRRLCVARAQWRGRKTTWRRVASGLIGGERVGLRNRCHRSARLAGGPTRRCPRGRRSVGVRVAVGRGQPPLFVPAVRDTGRRQRRIAARVHGVPFAWGAAAERIKRISGSDGILALELLADPPSVLIADELSLGLAHRIVDEVYATLATIRERGNLVAHGRAAGPRAITLAGDILVVVLERCGALRRPRQRNRRPRRRRIAPDDLSPAQSCALAAGRRALGAEPQLADPGSAGRPEAFKSTEGRRLKAVGGELRSPTEGKHHGGLGRSRDR